MGGLITSLLNREELPSDVTVDFENFPIPEGAELAIYNRGIEVSKNGDSVMEVLNGYVGCSLLIRQSMANPFDEAIQLSTFEGMFPNVERIRAFYQLAKSMDELGGKLARHFCDTQVFSPSLLKTFAQLLALALKFDRSKMMHPEIQNDFSQYRRQLSKLSRHPGVPVNELEANNVSMFIAQATPVISTLAITMDNLQRQGKDVSKFLADFAHICCAFVMRRSEPLKPEHAKLALTGMVVACILYDNINHVGVFGKGSLIDVRTCVGQLKLTDPESRGILCDALQYSTRSFDKASEPIKRVIEAR